MQTIRDSFNKISVKKGEEFCIALNCHVSAGYMWEFNVISGTATHLGELKRPRKPFDPRTTPIGGPVIVHTVFRADEAGELQIEATQRRPFDPQSIRPAKQMKFTINVE